MRRRGKAIARTAVGFGLAVLLGGGFAVKDRIREEWWIHKLKNGDEEEKTAAAKRLGEFGSERGVAALLSAVGRVSVADVITETWQGTTITKKPPLVDHIQDALLRIGRPATLKLVQALRDEHQMVAIVAAQALKRIYRKDVKRRENLLPVTIELLQVTSVLQALQEKERSEQVRLAAADALGRIQRDADGGAAR
jgi:HEAT repeat protein